MTVDPHSLFPAFYNNAAISALSSACRWTISGQLGELEPLGDDKAPTRKAPIDVRHLIDGCNPGCKHPGPVRGAWSIGPNCLMTLEELTTAVPNASNAAYYVQAQSDGLILIDVEPDCPHSVMTDLLRLPGILYSELSMSGKGLHMIAPLPANLHEFPVAVGKRVLRHEQGWYEILLDHWVTFTRRPVPQAVLDQVAASPQQPEFASVEELYASLAEKARQTANASATAVSTDDSMLESIPYAETIIRYVLATDLEVLNDPERFAHDMSRWEFSVLARLHSRLETGMRVYQELGASYTSGDTAWLLYRAATEVIPVRPKHAQMRNGRPFLLDRAAALVAERQADREAAAG